MTKTKRSTNAAPSKASINGNEPKFVLWVTVTGTGGKKQGFLREAEACYMMQPLLTAKILDAERMPLRMAMEQRGHLRSMANVQLLAIID